MGCGPLAFRELPAPRRVNLLGYRIGRQIGSGDHASVHLAHHASRGEVAVKVVAPRIARQTGLRERFLRAAETARRLDHPNVVRVYDAGVDDEWMFVVMEYLRGGDLPRNLAAGLHAQNVVMAIKQVATALEYAHRKGVSHGRVRPGNILFNSQGAALLGDFGISRLLCQATAATGDGVEASAAATGAGAPSPQADLRDLGVVLHETLTGRTPFARNAPLGAHRPLRPLPSPWARFDGVFRGFFAAATADQFANGDAAVRALDAVRDAGQVPDVVIRTDAVTGAEIDAVADSADRGERAGVASRVARRRLAAWALPLALLAACGAGGAWYLREQPAALTRALAAVGLTEHPDVVVAWQTAEALREDPAQGLGALVAGYRRVLERAPDHGAAMARIVELGSDWKDRVRNAIAAGEGARAATMLNELAAVFPDDVEVVALFDLRNDYRQAKRLLEDTALLLAGDGVAHPPAADHAIANYREALRLAPGNLDALAALDRIAARYGALAASAARRGDLPMAMENMERATAARADFKGAEQVRATLSEAEALQAQINTLLREAASLREEGALIDPPGNNASERYRRVLATKPDDAIAVQGLAEVASQVLADFGKLLGADDLDGARALLERATNSGVGDDLVAEMNGRYDDEINRIKAVNELVARAESLYADGYITGPLLEDNCVARLREVHRLDPDNADANRLLSVAATRLHTVAREAYDAGMREEGLRYLDLALTVTPGISRWLERRDRWRAELETATPTTP